MSTPSVGGFELMCELVPGQCLERFDFRIVRDDPFIYERKRADGLIGRIIIPMSEMPRSLVRQFISDVAHHLDITDGSSWVDLGYDDLKARFGESGTEANPAMISGIANLGKGRGGDMVAPCEVSRHIIHLLLRTRGCDQASSAAYQLSRGLVTLCLCDRLGGDGILIRPSAGRLSLDEADALQRDIALMRTLSQSEQARLFRAIYAESVYLQDVDTKDLA